MAAALHVCMIDVLTAFKHLVWFLNSISPRRRHLSLKPETKTNAENLDLRVRSKKTRIILRGWRLPHSWLYTTNIEKPYNLFAPKMIPLVGCRNLSGHIKDLFSRSTQTFAGPVNFIRITRRVHRRSALKPRRGGS